MADPLELTQELLEYFQKRLLKNDLDRNMLAADLSVYHGLVELLAKQRKAELEPEIADLKRRLDAAEDAIRRLSAAGAARAMFPKGGP